MLSKFFRFARKGGHRQRKFLATSQTVPPRRDPLGSLGWSAHMHIARGYLDRGRMIMRHVGFIAGALVVLFLAGSVHAQMQMVTGDTSGGDISFTLVDSETGDMVEIKVTSIGSIDAEDKADKIQKKVDELRKHDPKTPGKLVGGWGAIRDGNVLTFWHFRDGKKVLITEIKPGKDTTNEGTSLRIKPPNEFKELKVSLGGIFQFALDGSQVAAGADPNGNPSFVAVATSAGAAYLDIQPGDCAENLTQGLFQQLQAAGVQVWPTSPTSFMILDQTPDTAFMFCQITDVAIPVQVGGQVIE